MSPRSRLGAYFLWLFLKLGELPAGVPRPQFLEALGAEGPLAMSQSFLTAVAVAASTYSNFETWLDTL